MKVLLAGKSEATLNYQKVLDYLGVDYVASIDEENLEQFDKLILPGGVDINPKLYGQENVASKDIDDELDRHQIIILDHFARNKKPVLGICRGMQLINVYFKGTLIQDISTKIEHHGYRKDAIHEVLNISGTLMNVLYNDSCKINSSHHQCVDEMGRHFEITQMSVDGVIEGMQHQILPIIAVQWHPERTTLDFYRDDVADGIKLFRYFLQEM